MIDIVVSMSSGTPTIELRQSPPADFDITIDDVPTVNGEEIGRFVLDAKPVSVAGSFRWYEDTPEFRFDTSGQGFDQGKLGGASSS
jgi:hypothetical protein